MINLKYFRIFFNLSRKKLADNIGVEEDTIKFYEAGNINPSPSVLKKIISLFQITYDFFLLQDDCLYPRNLQLLKLAIKLDHISKSESRNTIENSAKSFLGDRINSNNILKYDSVNIELTNSFNNNLKKIRENQNYKQVELANKMDISRQLLSMYESKRNPPIDKLIVLADYLNISIHALVTGEKLLFNFQDGIFGNTMLLADHFLSLEEHKILIALMESFVKNASAQS